MMTLEAKKMGLHVIVLDPAKNCPSHSISDEHIVAGFDDAAAIKELAAKSDVVTYEFEHIGAGPLIELEAAGCKIFPTAKSLKVIQDKLTQKQALKEGGAPVGEFAGVGSAAEVEACGKVFGYPLMLKARTGGYDGKGNFLVKSPGEVAGACQVLQRGAAALMVEKFVDFEMEISVLACRTESGQTTVYPVGQNNHADSILSETRVPASISAETRVLALNTALQVMDVFKGVGMFCTEMFVLKDGGILINEVAPRPHNSGHYSIEGCVTSQFENHVRAVCGLPLGDTSLLLPVVMRNILGSDIESRGRAVVDGLDRALAVEGVKVHIYGKEESQHKRKMGHLTVMADTLELAAERAGEAWSQIKIY
ncbi:MAG: 5-(carboxyamino)imidazole ribonucleotide synthase [Spirochaetes bacterium]|nr:5-(carboxyamino)imidazole ribonucleotide synthase [Spirochaetota bacterium]